MLGKVFSQEGALWKTLNLLTDIFALSILWVLCCIPVLTAGASTTALYDSVVHCIRYREKGPYARFFRTFRNELKVSVPTTLLWGLLITLCLITLDYLNRLSSVEQSAFAAGAAWYVVMVIPVSAAVWAFTVLSRFTFPFSSLNLTAVKFAFGHLPSSVILALITLEAVQLCLKYIFPFAFVPALAMLLWSLFTEPVFRKLGGGLSRADAPPAPEQNSGPPNE